VAEAAGGKSQAVGLVGALGIVLLLLFAGGLTTYLPQASLAAIVIAIVLSLLAFLQWRAHHRHRHDRRRIPARPHR